MASSGEMLARALQAEMERLDPGDGLAWDELTDDERRVWRKAVDYMVGQHRETLLDLVAPGWRLSSAVSGVGEVLIALPLGRDSITGGQ